MLWFPLLEKKIKVISITHCVWALGKEMRENTCFHSVVPKQVGPRKLSLPHSSVFVEFNFQPHPFIHVFFVAAVT
jgi:hypothetical protein